MPAAAFVKSACSAATAADAELIDATRWLAPAVAAWFSGSRRTAGSPCGHASAVYACLHGPGCCVEIESGACNPPHQQAGQTRKTGNQHLCCQCRTLSVAGCPLQDDRHRSDRVLLTREGWVTACGQVGVSQRVKGRALRGGPMPRQDTQALDTPSRIMIPAHWRVCELSRLRAVGPRHGPQARYNIRTFNWTVYRVHVDG